MPLFFDDIGNFLETLYHQKYNLCENAQLTERNLALSDFYVPIRSLLNECHWHLVTFVKGLVQLHKLFL